MSTYEEVAAHRELYGGQRPNVVMAKLWFGLDPFDWVIIPVHVTEFEQAEKLVGQQITVNIQNMDRGILVLRHLRKIEKVEV